ncbi:uncharacterized protein ACR2FA_011958 [Aphomia sociella]
MSFRIQYGIILLFLISSNVNTSFIDIPQYYTSENVRVKRQAGYVYDKPSISFDLPTRPSTVSTQAPTVNRIQEQQMYYAYPVPASGDTVNIGYSSSTVGPTAATSSSSASAGGYNYAVQSAGASASQASSGGASGYNYEAQNSATSGSQSTLGARSTGYNYNVPTSTTTSTIQSGSVSTNAPKYLPPTLGGSSQVDTGVSVNVPSRGSTSGPPEFASSTPITIQSGSPGLVRVPDTNYLPPKPVPPSGEPSVIQTPSQTPSPTPAPNPTTGYLPPSSPGYSSVSTPAATYLPPVI